MEDPTGISVGIVSLGACALANPELGFPVGGAEVQLYILARALSRRTGFRVTLYVADCGQAFQAKRDFDVRPLVRMGAARKIRLWTLPAIVSRLVRGRHNAYITQGATAVNGLVNLAAHWAGGKHIHMCAHDDEAAGRADATLSAPARWLHHRGLTRADALTCQNRRQQHSLQQRFGLESTIISHLLPEENPGPCAARDGLLWVGRDTAWKQPEAFIELARRLPQFSCTMICQPQPGRDINRLSAQAPRNLRFTPGLPFHETARFFSAHRALVCTSAVEGYPIIFLQAACAGTPVLSLSVDPDDVIMRCGAGCVCGGSLDQLVVEAQSLLTDEAAWTRCHSGAEALARLHAGAEAGVVEVIRRSLTT